MANPQDFYHSQHAQWSEELKKLKKISFHIASARMAVFLLTIALLWFFWPQVLGMVCTLLAGIALFLFLVSRASDVRTRQHYARNRVRILDNELRALQGDFSPFQSGAEFLRDLHPYNQDIDLFGEGAFFPRIDRCETAGGRAFLAAALNANHTEDIEAKQALVQELALKAEWRHHFKASAGMIRAEIPSQTVLKWMQNHKPFLPAYAKWLSIPFALLSIGAIAAYALELVSYHWLAAIFFLGLAITGPHVRKITRFYLEAAKVKDTLAQYSALLEAIEKEEFHAEKLQEAKNLVHTDGKKASAQLRELAKLIDYLGNRNNMLFGPVSNGFLLWDLYFTGRIDRWFATHNTAVEDWLAAIERFDAWSSMGNYAFNHPTHFYPERAGEGLILKAEALAHPLIHPSKVVPNDFTLLDGQFFIVTGANMAGKSTFLRTISLSIVLANCGLPVPAKSFSYRPIALISSMRTSDSLQNEASYFFAELKRLKYIVDTIEERPYFIVLDEILKGTNSQDKAEGSKKFVERLLGTASVGIIATHDLSLCTLEQDYPAIQNRYFDAEIVQDELHFDYRLKMGVCKNMNASFLLKKMQIV